MVFILGLTISPALGAGSSSNKIKGKGVNLEESVVTDPEDDRKEGWNWRTSQRILTFSSTSGAYWIDRKACACCELLTPAPWGKYDTQLPVSVLVANLLHGGIGIHYDCSRIDEETTSIKSGGEVCDLLKADLENLMPTSYYQFIMTPYSAFDEYPITITGWRHHLKLMNLTRSKSQNSLEPTKIDLLFLHSGGN